MSGIDKNGRAGNSSETSKRQTNKTKTKHKPKQNQKKNLVKTVRSNFPRTLSDSPSL